MTDRRVKECIIFNSETGISEDGTMSDCLYRPRINQPKKEQKMTREEAIQTISGLIISWGRQSGKTALTASQESVIRLMEPITLADFLGWEEGQEYEWRGDTILMLDNGEIYYKSDKCSSGWCNYVFFGSELDDLRQAKRVEEPRYLLQTDLESENGVQYLSFDKKRKKYFIGAVIESENVQQIFTDSEITKIKSITRFAEICEKVEVE